MLMATVLPGQIDEKEAESGLHSKTPVVHTQSRGPQTWVNTDFYAQVSNVMPSGGVVLSPGQQLRIQESITSSKEEAQTTGKAGEANEETEKKQKELQFQLMVVDPDGSGYTTESNARQIVAPTHSATSEEGCQSINPQQVDAPTAATRDDNLSPYVSPDSPQPQLFAPVADYTVVQELNSQQSLLLSPPPLPSPPPCLPQNHLKACTARPVGYITPDLLGNLSP